MKQSFKHSLPVQTIVLRQDENSKTEYLESIVGKVYPLIRIKEHVVEFANIVSFNMSIGTSLLPKVSISIDDSDYSFRESNFIEPDDIITIFVGNAKDAEYEVIKNDYLITSAPTSPGIGIISIEAELFVPQLYEGQNRSFDMTSIEIFEKLAKEIGLGFVTNIQQTIDKMQWIQYQKNIDFLTFLTTNSRVSIDSKIMIFVDQFANLNVIDLKVAITDSKETLLLTDPVSGEKYPEPVKLVGSTNVMGNSDTNILLSSWSPINNFGSLSRKWPSKIQCQTFDILDNKSVTKIDSIQMHKQLQDSSSWSTFDSDNTYPTYASSKIINLNNSQLLQGTKLLVTLDRFIPVIFVMMTFQVEIWNLARNSQKVSQDASIDNEGLENIEQERPSNTYDINSRFSGNTLVQSMTLSFSRKRQPTASQRIIQSLQLFVKNK